VSIDKDSLSIPLENPFRFDLNEVIRKIEVFASSKSAKLNGLDIKGLIPKMVKGIAGCEKGCPANALQLAERGFKNFKIEYVEGGILIANVTTGSGRFISLKMFPDF